MRTRQVARDGCGLIRPHLLEGRAVVSVAFIVGGLLSAAAAQAQAQASGADASGPVLEEIIVTATKREQSVEKVPISIAAFTQDSLDKQDVKQFADVARLTPGVTYGYSAHGNSTTNTVSIRGISSGAGAATVGVYIDETPVQVFPDSLTSTNPYPKVFDLQRVEILRGPQGTLFGAGSEGGTIRFITPDPSLDRYSSYVRSDLATTDGGDPSYEVGAAGGGPIIENTLGFRVSGWYRQEGGYVDHINWGSHDLIAPNANSNGSSVLRAALRWQPVTGLNVTASVFHQQTDIHDSSTYWEGYSTPGNYVNANPLVTPGHDKFTLPAIKVNWEAGPVTLVSNTSYLSRTNDNVYDSTTLDMASFGVFGGLTPPAALASYTSPAALSDTQNVFTQEIRLQNSSTDSRFNWVIGAFYQHSRQTQMYTVENIYINNELGYVVPGLTVDKIFGYGLYQDKFLLYSAGALTMKEETGFGQVDWKATDKLTLTAGVRVAHHTFEELTFGAGPVVSSNGSYTPSNQSDTPVTPKYVVSYQINQDNMVYASGAKGYRQGLTTPQIGVRCEQDAEALGISTNQREIKPDTVWSYELGTKNRLFGGRLQLDSSVYWINWKDIQSGITLPNCQVPTTINAGTATSKGVDFALNLLATDALQLTLSVGYADAKFTSSTVGAEQGGFVPVIRSAGQPLDIPPWQGAISAQYDFSLFGHKSYARLSDQVQSHDSTRLDYASAATDPAIPRSPAFNNVGARFGMVFGGWDVSMYGENLANEHPEYSRYHDNPASINFRGITVRPLTIGLTGVYRY